MSGLEHLNILGQFGDPHVEREYAEDLADVKEMMDGLCETELVSKNVQREKSVTYFISDYEFVPNIAELESVASTSMAYTRWGLPEERSLEFVIELKGIIALRMLEDSGGG